MDLLLDRLAPIEKTSAIQARWSLLPKLRASSRYSPQASAREDKVSVPAIALLSGSGQAVNPSAWAGAKSAGTAQAFARAIQHLLGMGR